MQSKSYNASCSKCPVNSESTYVSFAHLQESETVRDRCSEGGKRRLQHREEASSHPALSLSPTRRPGSTSIST